ncbi:MAG: cytochrome c [Chloroflexi bacterium]|nr:MAG: cytochrome c [Chloroflexota bacterium]
MNQPYKFVFALLVVLGLALTACGGGGAERLPQESKSEPAPAQEQKAEPAAPAGDAVAGKKVYDSVCIACHGPDAKGIEGLGKDLTTSEFVAQKSDQELVEFIKVGRTPDDPLNTTGVAMPPKGGNPALTDEDLMNVVAFIRSIHQ